jgi:hypothetical protein
VRFVPIGLSKTSHFHYFKNVSRVFSAIACAVHLASYLACFCFYSFWCYQTWRNLAPHFVRGDQLPVTLPVPLCNFTMVPVDPEWQCRPGGAPFSAPSKGGNVCEFIIHIGPVFSIFNVHLFNHFRIPWVSRVTRIQIRLPFCVLLHKILTQKLSVSGCRRHSQQFPARGFGRQRMPSFNVSKDAWSVFWRSQSQSRIHQPSATNISEPGGRF